MGPKVIEVLRAAVGKYDPVDGPAKAPPRMNRNVWRWPPAGTPAGGCFLPALRRTDGKRCLPLLSSTRLLDTLADTSRVILRGLVPDLRLILVDLVRLLDDATLGTLDIVVGRLEAA